MGMVMNSSHMTLIDSEGTYFVAHHNDYWSLYILALVVAGTIYLKIKQPRTGPREPPEDHFTMRTLFGAKVLALVLMATITAPLTLWIYEAVPVFLVTGFVCILTVMSALRDCCIDDHSQIQPVFIFLSFIALIFEVMLFGNWMWMFVSCMFLLIGKLCLKYQRGSTTKRDKVFVRSFVCWLLFQSIHLFIDNNYFRLATQVTEGAIMCCIFLIMVTLVLR